MPDYEKSDIISRCSLPETEDGCWIWKATMNGNYGSLGGNLAHRLVYTLWHGDIPFGNYEVHHTCEVKRCCNPKHLELRTIKAHREHHGNQYTDAQFCVRGHEFTEANTYIYSSGKRACRQCRRDYHREYMRSRRHPRFRDTVGWKVPAYKKSDLNLTRAQED